MTKAVIPIQQCQYDEKWDHLKDDQVTEIYKILRQSMGRTMNGFDSAKLSMTLEQLLYGGEDEDGIYDRDFEHYSSFHC